MFRSAKSAAAKEVAASAHPPLAASVLAGGAIGFIAGLTGIGGGVFIAPFVLTFGWLGMRQTAGLSVLFNLLNSAAAFAGVWAASVAPMAYVTEWRLQKALAWLTGSKASVKEVATQAGYQSPAAFCAGILPNALKFLRPMLVILNRHSFAYRPNHLADSPYFARVSAPASCAIIGEWCCEQPPQTKRVHRANHSTSRPSLHSLRSHVRRQDDARLPGLSCCCELDRFALRARTRRLKSFGKMGRCRH